MKKATGKQTALRALVIDDDEQSAAALATFLGTQGIETGIAATLASAREQLAAAAFDLVMLDVELPDGRGTDLLHELRDGSADVVMISGQSTIDDAIAALRRGAVDFLQKPLDMPRLTAILTNLQRRMDLRGEVHDLRHQLIALGRFGDIVGSSPAMLRVYECIERVAPTNETVLIMGPSGAGKEVTAATIQKLSRRKDRPFVSVNCGAIAPSLIESELFGHERGAFTGADKRRIGLFEQADQGTLFLDEITEMPLDMQVRLLRVLETGRVTRVGGTDEVEVDVRILAATNRDPEEAVKHGKLRHDLLYRLLVFPIELPALKDRVGDIKLLATHFLGLLNTEYDGMRTLSDAALRSLQAHAWPGNVRELYNTLRRAYIMSTDEIRPADLLLRGGMEPTAAHATEPEHLADTDKASAPRAATQLPHADEAMAESHEAHAPTAPAPQQLTMQPGMPIAHAEKMLIEATLRHTDGNKKEAANLLGISVKTLYTRLQVYAAKNGD